MTPLAACPGADLMPSHGNAAKIGKATLCLLNAQRSSHGLGRLHANGRLRGAARTYSRLMVSGRFFDHVRLLEKDRPLDNRFVAFNCNESYHVFPNGHQRHVMLVNCGNGRSDCANVLLSG